ncbi:hypothetical protein BXT89_14455 [Halopseudomonas pachastrellae]|uniref:Uncharacterized protein n=1 Tax=Halopseudomonas pachastrellae TaxID=254161 RepID=A0A1S8DE56_9GAMM|nr:hypothetical protein [Halopseudomonas pachastrellae]ONM43149.1 hypothetical protein BXT89_14455 [Halopseudomonas pachastrellae]SFL71662.1 hypothetical protein SAMN05216256_101113 [Halopseudomonas pachastrellae]
MSANKVKAAALKEEDEWRAQDDLRTLLEAKKIQKDAKRMAKVRALAKQKMADMQALTKQ